MPKFSTVLISALGAGAAILAWRMFVKPTVASFGLVGNKSNL